MSFGNALKADLLGILISLALLLPPVLHFVTGPLGPAIAGYIVGSRERVDPLNGLLIGVLMGAVVAILAAIGLLVAQAVLASMPDTAPRFSTGRALTIAGAIIGFATVTASMGAVLGGQMSRRGAGRS